MSIIVCKILEDGFDIAADSNTIRGTTQTNGNNTNWSKLFEINDMIIGGTGRQDEISLLHLFAKTHRPQSPDEMGMLEFLSEFSDWKNKKINKSSIDNSCLIGYEGKVFAIEGWLVQEIVTYEAIGWRSMDFALAALYLGHTAKKAVETAIELSIYCEGPVQLVQYRAESKPKRGKRGGAK